MSNLKDLSTKDLVALYNRLTDKSIKKFSSRAAGEKQVAAAQSKSNPTPAPALASARTVRGSASAAERGRPKTAFSVELTEGKAKSKPHSESARMKMIEWMRKKEPGTQVAIEAVEKHFERPMRGVVQKLIEKGWLKRIDAA